MQTSEMQGHQVHFDKRWLKPRKSFPPGFRFEPMNDPLHFIILALAIAVGFLVLLGVAGGLMNHAPPVAPDFYSG
ncbi:MAG: hypothetical protein QF473_22980 [Planctomycetota bacterium]|jgi:hypothetical protein|nr:hypothetical protein [Planctomycetota bacterium]MDP6503673.1 hypothetical protein [Planctomycetota bacterium]